MKIERLYSDYQEEERLYSTGNDELDELMERAFCDGYEYAQREFANPGQFFTKVSRGTGKNKLSANVRRKLGEPLVSQTQTPTNSIVNDRLAINTKTLKPTLTGDLQKSISTRPKNSFLAAKGLY